MAKRMRIIKESELSELCPDCKDIYWETDRTMEGCISNNHKCDTALYCPRCGATVHRSHEYNIAASIYGEPGGDYNFHPGTKTGDEIAEYDRQRAVERNIIQTLTRIGSKFGSAFHLGRAVEELGLFHGTAYDEQDSFFLEEHDTCRPGSYAEQGWSHPVFTAGWTDNTWGCMVGFGKHRVELFFSGEGELVGVRADSEPSQRCWGEGNRVQQVLDLLD